MYENLLNVDSFMDNAIRTCYISWYNYAVLVLKEDGAPWPNAPRWQTDSIKNGISNILRNLSSALSNFEPSDFCALIVFLAKNNHENWLKYKSNEGWIYGEIKDVERKVSPCMVPYVNLPEDQRLKNEIFISTVLQLVAPLFPLQNS